MDIYFAFYIYFVVLAIASFSSLYRFKYLDTPSRIFSVLVCLSFLSEILAVIVGRKFHNNEVVYAFYELAEFALTSMYFNYSIDVFKQRHIGFYVAIAGLVLGSINILLVQRISSRNSFFMLFESIVIIAMALFAFFRFLLKNEDFKLHTYRHFWFISILIFFGASPFSIGAFTTTSSSPSKTKTGLSTFL